MAETKSIQSSEGAASVTLAFDVYGTIIDTRGVVTTLQHFVGSKAEAFSETWRQKQLEYSFRRGLMHEYVDFSLCTSQALDFACQLYGVSLAEDAQRELLASYQTLPVFSDVLEGLTRLQVAGFRLYALSNGRADAVEAVLTAAGVGEFFVGVISADTVQTLNAPRGKPRGIIPYQIPFGLSERLANPVASHGECARHVFKPDPAVYHHFFHAAATTKERSWLVSSNPFDVIGARAVGMRAAWVKRCKEAVFDPWGIEPTAIVTCLSELEEIV